LKKYDDWHSDEILRQKRIKVTETSTDEPHTFSHLPIQAPAAASSSSAAHDDDEVVIQRFIPPPGVVKQPAVIPSPRFLCMQRQKEALKAMGKPLAAFSLEELRRFERAYVELEVRLRPYVFSCLVCELFLFRCFFYRSP
jgi:hypothetical protein